MPIKCCKKFISVTIGLNSTLVTIIGLAIGTNQSVVNVQPLLLVVPTVGLLVSILWRIVIQSYRDINTAKFTVLHEIEDRLPLRLYSYEWHIAKQGDGTKYRPTSHVEMWIPILFAGLYGVILLVQIFSFL